MESIEIELTCDETWKYQVYLNDDKEQLLMDHMNWTNMHGRHLLKEDRQNILSSFPRLDIICDTDDEDDYDIQFEVITEHLQLNLAVPYSFDPIQSRFMIHRDA